MKTITYSVGCRVAHGELPYVGSVEDIDAEGILYVRWDHSGKLGYISPLRVKPESSDSGGEK